MILLMNERDVSLDTQEAIELKKALNAWSNSIKNHNFQNLGDQSNISTIVYKPAYIVDLLTRYEKRILAHTQVSFKGQTVEEQTITDLAQVKRWDYKLTRDGDDLYKVQYWSIPGSKKVITCPECSGKKKVKCPDCNHGKVVCHHCNGVGKFSCTSCNGKGYHICSNCSGVGYTTTSRTKTRKKYTSYAEARDESYTEYTKHPCKSCEGKGHLPCKTCNSKGVVSCTTCNGSGKLVCNTCGGSAQITCPTCSGTGQVLKYIQLGHSYDDVDRKRSKLYESLVKNFPKLSELSKTFEGDKIFEENENSFPENYLSNYPYISEDYNSLYKESLRVVKESNDSIIVDQQLLLVNEISVYEISYSYNQKNYSILICGSDRIVYAPISPISEFSDSLLKKAKKSYNLKQFSKSLDLLEKCISMNQENVTEAIYELKEKAIKHINRDYKVGSIIGLVLSISLYTLIINALSSEIYFILPRVTKFYHRIVTLPKVVPWMLTAIFAIIMIWFKSKNSKYTIDKYGIKIKSSLFRLSASVINYLIFAVFVGIVLYLINSTGLLNPIALIIGFVFEIFLA